MRPDRLASVTLSIVEVSPRTRWIFLEAESEAGLRGVGEATLPGQEDAVTDAVAELDALALASADPAAQPMELAADLPHAAARSALDHALWDIRARRRGERMAEALGGTRRDRVPVYANINRRTVDRSPATFAKNARMAIAAGHRAIKLAPFDEATPARCRYEAGVALGPGLARIAAVREAIGATAALMVDCHWRLDSAATQRLIDAAAEFGVTWIECPLPETEDRIEAIRAIRSAANRRGIALAGLETAIGVDGFMPFVRAGVYDVVMPDVKYVGGLDELLRLAAVLDQHGIGLSLHNPSGPIAHAVSLQVSAALERVHSLEIQFGESPLFLDLVGHAQPDVADGSMAVPAGAGSGAALIGDVLEGHGRTLWCTGRAEVHRSQAEITG